MSHSLLVNAGGGRLLDVVGQATADGSPVNTWTPNSGANQRWTVLEAGADPSGANQQWQQNPA